MSTEPTTSPSSAVTAPGVVITPESVATAPIARGMRVAWLAVLALAVAIGVGVALTMQLAAVKRDSTRRIGELQQSALLATENAARADAEARAARQQAGVLEARLAELESQRDSLEQLYADLSRGRDEAVLVEVERLVTLAAQELQFSGNVPTALAALQTADARVARLEAPRLLPLRRVLARDIERLRAAPAVDVTGIALKFDQLINSVESWPMLSDATGPSSSAPLPAKSASPPAPRGDTWWDRMMERVQRELGEYRDLIRIRTVDAPDATLLTQQQQNVVRQLVRLRLLNARQALLARNDRLYRADLAEAQSLMTRFFDTKNREAGAALGSMKQLASAALSVDTPNVNDSVAAVRAARTAPAR